MRHGCLVLCSAIFASSLTVPRTGLADEALAWSGSVTLTTDYAFRGVSQTLGEPALQALLLAETGSGFYAYAWGSNVDFVPDGVPHDGADVELDFGFGYALDIGDRVAIDVALVRYLFPDTRASIDYDYNEFVAALTVDGSHALRIAYSSDVFGSGSRGVMYGIETTRSLPGGVGLQLGYGYYDLDRAFGASYSFADLAVSRPIGRAEASLAYHRTFGETDRLFYPETTGPRFALALEFAW